MAKLSPSRVPASTACYSALHTPEILREILLFVKHPTLAVCLRVSRSFFVVAGPLLYGHLRLNGELLKSPVLLGHDIRNPLQITRNRPSRTNFKLPSLENTKTLTLQVHRCCQSAPGSIPILPSLRTLRISYSACVTHFRDSTPFRCNPTEICLFPGNQRFRKLVIRDSWLLPSEQIIEASLRKRQQPEIITLIIGPGFDGKRDGTLGKALRPSGLALRLVIFCPLSSLEDRSKDTIRHCCRGRAWAAMLSFAEMAELIADAIARNPRTLEIYMLADLRSDQTSTAAILSGSSQSSAVQTSEGGKFEISARIDETKIHFKSRADYLREGLTDELEPEEVAMLEEMEAEPSKDFTGFQGCWIWSTTKVTA